MSAERFGCLSSSLVAAAVVVAAAGTRVLWSGAEDLEVARQAREAGLVETAVEFYGRAARWYLPVVGYHGPARRELAAMCRDLESRGSFESALRCDRVLRGAILATRWLYTPDEDLLEESNRAIARLVAREVGPDGRPVLDEAEHLRLLARDESPNPWLSALAVLWFCGWLGTAGYGFYASVTPDGRVHWRRLGRWSALALLLAILWLVTLRLA